MNDNPPVGFDSDRVAVGERFVVTLHRTLRLPMGHGPFPLPAGLGHLPMWPVDACTALVPVHPHEAVWVGFTSTPWKPTAVVVLADGVNAITGSGERGVRADPQSYLVCPPQVWIDGFNTGFGVIRQFVAAPYGSGRTAGEASGGEPGRGLELAVYDPVPGRFPDAAPPPRTAGPMRTAARSTAGLAAGAEIIQKLYPDPHGVDTWLPDPTAIVRLLLVAPAEFEAATGRPAPPTPIDEQTYQELGIPFFMVDDAGAGAVDPSPELARLPDAIPPHEVE